MGTYFLRITYPKAVKYVFLADLNAIGTVDLNGATGVTQALEHEVSSVDQVHETGFIPGWEDVYIEQSGVAEDPEAGCSCGRNCERGPGDPCPLEKLQRLAEARDVTWSRLVQAGLASSVATPASGWSVSSWIQTCWCSRSFEWVWSRLCAFGPRVQVKK